MPLKPRDVFVNCPFDASDKPIFNAVVFAVTRSGFRARCALETDNAADDRLAKVCDLIAECQFGIHDISRTEADGTPPLPRFNMPLELGLFLGAERFGGRAQAGECCIVFDRERCRFQRFISDIACQDIPGQDVRGHGGGTPTLIRELATWLRDQSRDPTVPGGRAIAEEYATFDAELAKICAARRLDVDELTFGDVTALVGAYLTA